MSPTVRNLLLSAATAFAALPCVAQIEEAAASVRPRPLPADASPQVAPTQCGRWVGFYGPFDYRTASTVMRRRVESYHLDDYLPRFLAWPVGRPFDDTIAANIAYTLRAFPNHPVGLTVMEQIGRRLKSETFKGSDVPVECWFVRALMTVPDDPMVRGQYGVYLAYRGRKDEARRELALGDRGLCASPPMQYQIGVARVEIGDHALAQKNALRAARLGYPLTNLRERIERAGKWDRQMTLPEGADLDCASDPDPAAEAASAPEAPASASAPAAAASSPADAAPRR
jgi:hypothetical protein